MEVRLVVLVAFLVVVLSERSNGASERERFVE